MSSTMDHELWQFREELKRLLKGINVVNLLGQVEKMQIMTHDTASLIELQNNKIATLEARINTLENELRAYRIAKMGTGPTA